ncbi:hypothetical protein [Actinoplanes xinjiangensis]|uniref:hypothetical protein n=1 Tax=Actinoplanes xinjiangensis TaxID=512350 RepID=UPI0011B71C99|nr:hypothetical protein [Actinoplanes xinjiangensis]
MSSGRTEVGAGADGPPLPWLLMQRLRTRRSGDDCRVVELRQQGRVLDGEQFDVVVDGIS